MILLTAAILASATVPAQIPRRPTPLLDGRCEPKEWGRAHLLAASDGRSARAMHDGRYLYLCIDYPEGDHGSLDGYLVTDRQRAPFNFHVSAKVGQRVFDGKSFPKWTWWNARHWWGNASVPDGISDGSISWQAPDERELQFDLDHFGRSGWKLLFELHSDGPEPFMLPASARFDKRVSWIPIRFR